MPYDEQFWRLYQEYLKEPTVRKNHDHMFRMFASLLFSNSPRIIDLGCGLGEYARYDEYHAAYAGIDLNNTGAVPNFICQDYLKLEFSPLLPFVPDAFVSLFSAECCQPANTRYAFYEKLFVALPTLECGLVSGFFYDSRRGQETVSETGGITSHQTVEDPSLHISAIFTELRTHLHTPSQMFGQDVIEVWKLLVRK